MTWVGRVPFTLVFIGIMVLANLGAGTLAGELPAGALARWGLSHQTVAEGEFTRLLSATFLSHDVGMFLRQLVFAATVIGYFEWHHATLRTVTTFFAIDIVGTVIVLFAVVPLAAAVSHPEARATLDVGMSAGGFGLIGAILAGWRHSFLLLLAVLGAIAAKVAVRPDLIADSAHAICLLIGFAVQLIVAGQTRFRGRKENVP
ncbi:hypothetical protein [Microbulbifer sp. S227A]|uniref:hypothetical protein n=1 Tax=Microbulbifer sp. S227A TaxID=3415131 RepID=UPI003C7D0331